MNKKILTRRKMIKIGLLGVGGLMLGGPLNLFAKNIARKSSKIKAKAKSVIQIWMWGGSCHIDTFDPKPQAGHDYCGDLDNAIETNVKRIKINAALPLLAHQADKYSLIRSMTHGINAHETASYIMQTGHEPGRLVYPSAGAIVSLFKGYAAGYKGVVPPYVVLTKGQGRFSESGFLGSKYKPFVTGGDPSKNLFEVEGIIAKGVSDERQLSRRGLLHNLDTLSSKNTEDFQFKKIDKCEKKAYDLMFGDAKKIFDLSNENTTVRERYGKNKFGQSCLVARRLVEADVPYITINYNGWDTHKQHFQIMKQKLPEFDQGLSALLQDLSDKNLLDSTIIWCCGEFGRTPKVMWDPPWNGGRGHFGQCFSALVAGGGFKGGRVVGKSNETGTEVIERPVHPEDLIGSIYELMGIDPEGKLPNSKGLNVKLLPGKGNGRLKEIM
ncbi:MAG: DUF1501 domain-containing protein [Chlamydiae bacterium]|nr:MAG: DUF1501 domain-containing protein [Chlamydiota bacterium]